MERTEVALPWVSILTIAIRSPSATLMVSGNVTTCPTRGVDGEGVPIVTDRDSGVGAGVVGVGVGLGVGVTGDGLGDDVQADVPTSSVTSNRRFIVSTLPNET